MARAAREQLVALRPEVVVCHNIFGWSAAVLPAIRSLGLPLVLVLHDHYLRCVRSNMFNTLRCTSPCLSCRIMRLPHRRLSQAPDAVVGVSRFVLQSHLAAGYFREVPLRTHIHNVSHLDTRGLATPPRAGAEIVFGFIGGLAPAKGVELLLQSFRAVARPNWRLRVAGTGESGYVEHLRTAYSDRRIEFLGRQDAAAFFPALDATVVPSVCDDTLPSVVFESLVFGRPVIGSLRGGIPEMIEHGRSGLLFEPDDRDGLQNALNDFAAEAPAWRLRQAAMAADAAPRYCDRERWLVEWDELLRRVVTDHRPAS
jgi:glycosyltransferase involved in cell wall biosynthesis